MIEVSPELMLRPSLSEDENIGKWTDSGGACRRSLCSGLR